MRFRDSMTDRVKKIGILWGGGLGDLLMIRPLLTAAHADGKLATYLFTTASHAAGLFQEFCAPTPVVQLPRKARDLPTVIKKWRHFFDLLYLGPYPTLKTRMLARLLQPEKIWSRQHLQAHPFMLEQVFCDCKALGLDQQGPEGADFRSLLPWPVDGGLQPFLDQRPFVVVHAGAKQGWETKSWPAERWAGLVARLLQETACGVCFAGVAAEGPAIERILDGLPAWAQGRIRRCLSWPVRDAARLIKASTGVICHNSGILHLACFLGKQTVCITGASAPYWQPPYPWVKNISSGGCGLACNRYTCPVPFYRAKCVNNLAVEDVWAALRQHGVVHG